MGESLSEAAIQGFRAELAQEDQFSLNLVVIQRCIPSCWIPGRFFQRSSVPMTKEEIRVVTLALCLKENIVLGCGAGTGSVAIEAARLLSRGMVFTVEKTLKHWSCFKKMQGGLKYKI